MTCVNKYVTLFFIFFHNNNNKFDMCLTNISHYFSFCSFLFTSPRKKNINFLDVPCNKILHSFYYKTVVCDIILFLLYFNLFIILRRAINFSRLYFVWNTKRKVNHIPDSLNWLTMISRLNSLGMLVENYYFFFFMEK